MIVPVSVSVRVPVVPILGKLTAEIGFPTVSCLRYIRPASPVSFM